MTEDEFVQYWEPACVNLFGAKACQYGDCTPYNKLDKFLGVNEFKLYRKTLKSDEKPMREELRRKVALLASPYWRAVLIANDLPVPELKHET